MFLITSHFHLRQCMCIGLYGLHSTATMKEKKMKKRKKKEKKRKKEGKKKTKGFYRESEIECAGSR